MSASRTLAVALVLGSAPSASLDAQPPAETSVSLPERSATDVRAIEQRATTAGAKPESTIAIDMRHSLLEARRTAQGGGEK